MKTCNVCGLDKSIDEFYPRSGRCKPCHIEKARLTYERRKAEDIEGLREEWRKRHHRQRYQLDPDDYQAMVDAQGGACAACGGNDARIDPRTQRPLRLSVDHDHACCPGKRSCGECIRGLLCQPCNIAIAQVGDSVERLRSLIAYLERHG